MSTIALESVLPRYAELQADISSMRKKIRDASIEHKQLGNTIIDMMTTTGNFELFTGDLHVRGKKTIKNQIKVRFFKPRKEKKTKGHIRSKVNKVVEVCEQQHHVDDNVLQRQYDLQNIEDNLPIDKINIGESVPIEENNLLFADVDHDFFMFD